RVVPCPDAGAYSERLAARVGEVAPQVVVVAVEGRSHPGEVLDAVGAAGDVDLEGLGDGLSGIHHLEAGQLVVALPQDPGSPVHDPGALGSGHRRPDLESAPRRFDCPVDVLFRCLVDHGDDLPSRRVERLEGLTGGGGDLPAFDEEMHFPHVGLPTAHADGGWSLSPAAWVSRSRMIAMVTTAIATSNPSPVLVRVTARTASNPSPWLPARPAMMTIASTIMITWLTPAMIVGAASGSLTPNNVCRSVAPKALDASSASAGTWRTPRAVRRMPGTTAYRTEAMIPGTALSVNSITTGMR